MVSSPVICVCGVCVWFFVIANVSSSSAVIQSIPRNFFYFHFFPFEEGNCVLQKSVFISFRLRAFYILADHFTDIISSGFHSSLIISFDWYPAKLHSTFEWCTSSAVPSRMPETNHQRVISANCMWLTLYHCTKHVLSASA